MLWDRAGATSSLSPLHVAKGILQLTRHCLRGVCRGQQLCDQGQVVQCVFASVSPTVSQGHRNPLQGVA